MDTSTLTPAELAQAAADVIAEKTGVAKHDIMLTLGSGWGDSTALIGESLMEIPAQEVPGFFPSTVPGHRGTIESIKLPSGRHVLVVGCRAHLYEGHGVEASVHNVRTAYAAGASIAILTNGAGSNTPEIRPGTPVLLDSHINLTHTTPLEGANFIDMSQPYSARLRQYAREVDPFLPESVYASRHGPAYETTAEIRLLRTIGANLVGMSTALECIMARYLGMEVLGISLATNLTAGVGTVQLSHDEVLEAGANATPRIQKLLAGIISRIDEDME